MNVKDFIVNIAYKLKAIDSSSFNTYLYSFIGVVVLAVGFLHYNIYVRADMLRKKIKTLQDLSQETKALVDEFELLEVEESRLRAALARHGNNFHIKIYFEQLCKDKNLTGFLQGRGWDIKLEELNDEVLEESVSAVFQGITTEILVNFLDEINNHELVYIKNLRIRPDKDKKITIDFAMATIKNK